MNDFLAATEIIDFAEIWPEPLAVVVETLRKQSTADALAIDLSDLASPRRATRRERRFHEERTS